MTEDLIHRAERLLELATQLGPGWVSDKLIVEIEAILECLDQLDGDAGVLALDDDADALNRAFEAASLIADDRCWPTMISYAVH